MNRSLEYSKASSVMGVYEVNAELMAKRNQVISLNGEIARKNVEIACYLEQIARKDNEIKRKTEDNFSKAKEIALKNDEIARMFEEILKLEGKLRQYRDIKEAFKQIEDSEDNQQFSGIDENLPEEVTVLAAAEEPDKMGEEIAENQEKNANLEALLEVVNAEKDREDNLEADDEESSGSKRSSPNEQHQIDAGLDNSHASNKLPGLSIHQLQRWCGTTSYVPEGSSITSSISPNRGSTPIHPQDSSDNTPKGDDKPLVRVTPRSLSSGFRSADLNSTNSDPDPRTIFHHSDPRGSDPDSIISGHGLMVGDEFLINPAQMSGMGPVPMSPMGHPMLMGHHPQMRPVPPGYPMVPQMDSPMGKVPMGPMGPMHMGPTMVYHPQMGPTMMYHPQMGPAGQHPLKITNRPPPMGPFFRPIPMHGSPMHPQGHPQMEMQPNFSPQTGEPMTD